MTTFQITVNNEFLLKKLTTFLKEYPTIRYTVSSSKYEYSEKFDYIPTREFVGLCGQENLNRNGYISEKGAMDSIIMYANLHNLYFKDYIELNEYLRDVLNLNCMSISLQDLCLYFKTLFRVA